PDDVWVVGNEGTILRWNGRSWQRHPTGVREELSGVFGHGPRDIWVVGNKGTLLHWDGHTWLSPQRRPTDQWLYGLCDGSAPGELWAVGTYGTILRFRP
ncbi:MAG: glucosyltransferase-I, partial [Myxococcota bacterium]|nr:glucosyltransferase-I [Myxococcota bacterium]